MDSNRVLIVDDNIKNVQVIGSIIRKMGLSINIAQSGKQALDILESVTPVLILCDIKMPEMSGFEFFKIIKQNLLTKDIPLIFLTASNDEEDETKGLEMGAADFIRKPINPPVLIARAQTQITLQQTFQALQEALKSTQQQNILLEENSRLKEEVERISRHDLKNPLQAVISIPDLILDDDNLTNEQKLLLTDVQNAGLSMLTMIDSSLDIYKMEVGTYRVDYNRVDLIAICLKIRNNMSQLLIRKNLKFQLLVGGNQAGEGERFTLYGEDILLYTMVSNLVKNAIEASPDEGVITVNLEAGDFAAISIENSGDISEEFQKVFFDRYATSGKKKGTGLGTYSAKLIAETLKGSVTLDLSEPDTVKVVIKIPTNRPVEPACRL